MTHKLRILIALGVSASAAVGVTSSSAQAPASARPAGGPTELFRTALPDAPGK
jgi:hypothetical protein